MTNQLKNGHRRCDAEGWEARAEYIDNDLSATYGGPRPDYQRLLGDIRIGLVKRIVVLHLSRLWRNRRERAEGIEIMRDHRVTLVCIKGPTFDFSTAYGRSMAGMLGEADSLEVELKSERHQIANAERARQGLPHPGGHRAFGYQPGGMELVDEEAQAIREAYDLILSGGSLRSVARMWNAAGLYSGRIRTGKHRGEPSTWTFTTVSDVLKNPRNAGIRVYQGEEFPAQWPAIVSEEVYRAVAGILSDPNRRPAGAYGVALLSTVAVCGECGATVHAGGGNLRGKNAAQGKRHRTYRCSENTGKHIARKAEPIDQLIEQLVIGRLSMPDALDLVAGDQVDVAALISERETYRQRQVQLAEAFADGELTAAQMRAGNERLSQRIAVVEQAIADAGRVSALGPLVATSDVEAAWRALDVDRKRAVLRELFEVIRIMPVGRGVRTFRPESVEIEWRAPAT